MRPAPPLAGRLTILFGALLGVVTLSLLLTLWAFAKPYAPGFRRAAAFIGLSAMAIGGAILAARLAQEVAKRERALLDKVLTDEETGLLSRSGLERRLPGLAGSRPVFVAAFGVERYAQMRGVLGHQRCAQMLRRLGTALSAHHPDWITGRLAADILGAAFAADDLPQAQALIAQAVCRLQASQVADSAGAVDVRLVTGLSTGASQAPPTLVREADVALDEARSLREPHAVFDPASHARSADTLSLMAALREAIAAGDLALHHQPKFCLRSRTITGVESLVRWTDPVRGPVSPDRFIALAEETGDIRALTEWVLTRAVQDQAAMAAAGRPLTVSVNLSGRLVGDEAFTDVILDITRRAPGRICLEVTETAVIARPEGALAQFRRFREQGLTVAIDDYGSGLSSLAYLKTIEADELKIDRAFITALATSPRDAILVRSTVDLAHALGMTATAEGVEDAATERLLAIVGCDHVQGWHVGKALPVDELIAGIDALEAAHDAA
ncbi:hypothetical protein BH09PSE2_BH09PSE2_01980 [soil metagenome]